MSEKKYPIGGYAPGNYQCTCSTCKVSFHGDKRATQCEPCAVEAKARFDALPIEEQMQLIKRNSQIAQVLFERPESPERDLILRIVEQWGNAMQMDNMEQWLKDYAATQQPGAAWIKASTRIPSSWHLKCVRFIHTKQPLIDPQAWLKENEKAIEVVEWLDESAEQPGRGMITKEQFDSWHTWLSTGGYTYDGEYYYDEENNYYTTAQLWEVFKKEKP